MKNTREERYEAIAAVIEYLETIETIEEPTIPEEPGTIGDGIILMCEVCLWSSYCLMKISEEGDEEELVEVGELAQLLNRVLRGWLSDINNIFDTGALCALTAEWMPVYLGCRTNDTLGSLRVLIDTLYEEEL